MRLAEVQPESNWTLRVVSDDGRVGYLDVYPYLEFEGFAALKDRDEFVKVTNGGYFIEWPCGADLSADTIAAKWKVADEPSAAVVV